MLTQIKKIFFSDKKINRLLWAFLVLAIMISGLRTLTIYDRDMAVFLRISMKSPEVGNAVLYYDTGRQFNAKDVNSSPIYIVDKLHDVKIKIPFNKTFYHLRFDPPSVSSGEIVINKVDIVDRYGRILHDFNLRLLKPANQIEKFDLINSNIHFSINERANDPQITILIDRPITFNKIELLALMLTHRVIPEFFILLIFFVLLIYIWSRVTDSVIAFMIILAILASVWVLYHDFQLVYYRFSMKSMFQGDTAELFYDQGYGLSETAVVKARVHQDNLFHDYSVKIPRDITYLRFDPLTTPGTVVIKSVEITDRFGNVLKSFTLNQVSQELSAVNQIKAFEFSDEGLKVTTVAMANDPQISILLDEKSIQQIQNRTFTSVKKTLMELSLTFVLLIISIVIWKRYNEGICRLIDGAFFQEKIPVIYLGCSFGLIIAMVVVGNRTCHPDEWGHILSAGYYSDSWLLGAVDDPKVLKTVGGWGVSYLFRIEAVYWFAGKVSSLLSGLIYGDYLRVRLFNAILFLILGLIVVYRARGVPLLSMALVVSPQIWYVFSYFNGDAFPFFISIMIAWQLIDTDSMTNQYLKSANLRDKISGGAIFGILVGIMLLSKMNYYLYVVFVIFIIAWRFIFEQKNMNMKSGRNLLWIKKGLFIAGVSLCIYLPPVVYDQYINDFKKYEKILIVAERYAVSEFKPSMLRNNISKSHQTMRLRDKGMSLKELFLHNPEWRNLSLKSFFGLYGNMNYYSDSEYYQAVTYVLGLFFLLVFFYIILTFPGRDVIFILFVLIFAGLAVGQSVYNSWVNDYEPQGRYLFMIIPMIMIGLAKMPNHFRTRVIPLFNLVFFFLSTWSFLFMALKPIPKLSGCG